MNDADTIRINSQLGIPLREITFRFTPSSGPGGQHANKAATRVTLFFDVANSPTLAAALSETARERLLARLASRLDSEGVLQISVQESRSQHKNRETAVARFQSLLAEALKQPKPRRKSRPSRAAVERRLQQKKAHAQRKKERGRNWFDG